MKVVVLTADSGQSDQHGKTHALGLGWTWTYAPTIGPMAVVVRVEFDNRRDAAGPHTVVLSLLDSEHEPVFLDQTEPFRVEATLTPASEPDVPPDAPAVAPLIVNIGPGIPLEPESRYWWHVTVDGHSDDGWCTSFYTRAAPSGEAALTTTGE